MVDVTPADLSSPEIQAPLPLHTKILYGLGQYGEGIINASMTSLLFFYYSQVLAVPPSLVGLGLLLAGVTDGVLDAFVGLWSDSTTHRWGRRHPYLYGAVIPVGVTLVAIYTPPGGMSSSGMFAWLLCWAFLMRAALTLFVIPHWAMGAELSKNYHERTTVVAYRIFFSFFGNACVFFASVFVFRTAGAGGDALLDPTPYHHLGWILAAAAALSILGCALGTHWRIPYLPKATAGDKGKSIRDIVREVRELFTNRPFRIFFFAANIFTLGLLGGRVLDIFMGKYFWRFNSQQVLLLPGLTILGFAAGTMAWAGISRRIGKRNAYIAGVGGYSIGMVLLPLLKIFGVLPDQSSGAYFPIVAALSFTSLVSASAGGVIAGSVLADVADDYKRQSGKNKAGLISGALVFCTKAMTGVTQLMAGIVLSLIGLQQRAPVDSVPTAVSTKLGLFTAVICGLSGLGFALVFRRYPIPDRKNV